MPTLDDLIDRMTLEEQVSLLSGEDFWSLPAIERLGIGKFRVTDGPNGARGGGSLIGGVKSAAFPVGIAIGATWNPALVGEIGAALADEVKSKGAHVLLGPTINIQRTVTNGRNFECYSEDPVLTAELASAYVKGLQQKGISAVAKHFAGNESEIARTSNSSVIDERSLREVYLLPFERAVKDADLWGIMTAYNKVNGTFASEHAWLITDVLRGDWGFDGVVMSDWFGSHSTAETVNAGLDLEMPGPTRDRGDKLIEAVKAGKVSHETIRDRVRAILTVMERTGALGSAEPFAERADDRPEHRALIRKAGAEAAVLLKNEDALPLSGKETIAVIGPNARTAQIMGGGSAQLNPHYRVSPYDGLAAALGAENLTYAEGCTNFRFQPLLKTPLEVSYFDNDELSGEPVFTATEDEAELIWIGNVADGKVAPDHFSARLVGEYIPRETATHQVGLVSAGLSRLYVNGELVADAWTNWTRGRTYFEEGCDEVVGSVDLVAGEPAEIVVEYATRPASALGLSAIRVGISVPLGEEAIEEAAALAAKADVALVFAGRSGEWDTEGSDLESIMLPGRQDALIAAIARANPKTIVVLQTGGPVEMPWLDDVAGLISAWYPGQEAGNAITDVLLGKAEPGGRLAQTFPAKWSDNPAHSQDPRVYPGKDGEVEYREGVFIGYRHYDRHGIAPLFPFGFGLSYTSFSLGKAEVAVENFDAETTATISLTVENIGDRRGSTVAQLYVCPKDSSGQRPRKELKAFAKVDLAPGESGAVRLALSPRDFAHFDTEAKAWRIAAGEYDLSVGESSASLKTIATLVKETEGAPMPL